MSLLPDLRLQHTLCWGAGLDEHRHTEREVPSPIGVAMPVLSEPATLLSHLSAQPHPTANGGRWAGHGILLRRTLASWAAQAPGRWEMPKLWLVSSGVSAGAYPLESPGASGWMQKVRSGDNTSLCASVNRLIIIDSWTRSRTNSTEMLLLPVKCYVILNACLAEWGKRFCLGWEMFVNPLLDFPGEVNANGKSC